MMKKLLCTVLCLSLCLSCGTLACAEGAEPVTAAELEALASSLRTAALASQPINDPADENAQTEDGTRFQYENFVLYTAGTELTESAVINAVLFEDSEDTVFRLSGIDTQVMDLLALLPCEREDLPGTREGAVLYLRESAEGNLLFAAAARDGQRIASVQAGELLPAGDAYRCVSVTWSLQNGLVTMIRVEGLNADAPNMDADGAAEFRAALEELAGKDEYRAVRSSRNGTELTAFGPEDLVFSGFDYTALTPETLGEATENELIDNEDGTWLMRCDGEGYEAVFRCGAQGENPEILSFTILDDGIEGPRCVRLGDLLSEDYCRFRSEGNDMGEDMKELLYGEKGAAPWGEADFDFADGEASLRYVTEAGGSRVELLLVYTQNTLEEIIIHSY